MFRPNYDSSKIPLSGFFKAVSAAVTLEVYEQIVHVTMTTAAYAITLPNVSQAIGRIYTFYIKTNATPRVLTIQDQDDSFNWSDMTLNTVGSKVVLFSDGRTWHDMAQRTIVDASVLVGLGLGTTALIKATHSVQAGKTLLLDNAGGILANLPAATGSGDAYKFLITVTVTSADVYKIAADSTDTIQGMCYFMTDTSGVMIAFKAGGAADYVNMDGSTQGGLVGAVLVFTDIGSGIWDCQYHGDATGTEATPFVAT